jgi:hypothetical protein
MRIRAGAAVVALFCLAGLGWNATATAAPASQQQALPEALPTALPTHTATPTVSPTSGQTRTGSAAPGPTVGWWSASPLDKAVSQLLLPLQIAGTATVPKDGMLASSSATGPTAIGAVAQDAPISTLAVPVLGSRPKGATVYACPLTASFTAIYGGAWAAKPAYDCTTADVVGVLDASGGTITFDLASLAANAVALITQGAGQRVVLGDPQVTTAAAVQPSAGPTSAAPAPASGTTAPVGSLPQVATAPALPVTAGSPVGAGAVQPVLTPRVQVFPPSAPTSFRTATRTRSILSLVLVLACIVYWSDGFGAFRLRPRTRLLNPRIPFWKGTSP